MRIAFSYAESRWGRRQLCMCSFEPFHRRPGSFVDMGPHRRRERVFIKLEVDQENSAWTCFCLCTGLVDMHTKDPRDPEDNDSESFCSLFTTSTATTLHNTGAGRTMGTLISWGGRAVERTLARMAYKIGRCPRAIEHRVRKRIDKHIVCRPCSKHCSECNALRKDTLRLVDYIRCDSFVICAYA